MGIGGVRLADQALPGAYFYAYTRNDHYKANTFKGVRSGDATFTLWRKRRLSAGENCGTVEYMQR